MVKKKTSNTNDIKQAKLKTLANRRVPKAVKALAVVGNLASYAPTQEQSQFIVSRIEKAVKEMKERFAGKMSSTDAFELP